MKTAMEKKETGLMRQIGYLSFVVWAYAICGFL